MPNIFDRAARDLLPASVRALQERAFALARQGIAPVAAQVDEAGEWPQHSFQVLAKGGLMGLTAPKEVGGSGEGLVATAAVTEAIAESCSSSAICYGMHCVGTAVIAAKASDYHKHTFLGPIAEGRHITTLALSESGTGSQFWISETKLESQSDSFLINGMKQFVTNGGHADSYVMSSMASEDRGPGVFNML